MGYSKMEQETVLVFNNEDGDWTAYSTVPSHIKKLMSIAEMTVLESEDGRPIAVRGKLNKKQVSMKQERVMSEEQRVKLSERMKGIHNK